MRTLRVQIAALTLTILPACVVGSGEPEVPAVIVHPTPESRAALERAVRAALNDAPVTIADDALTHDSLLVIERTHPRDAEGRLLSGRELGKPEQFRLVKRGSDCILIHERTGRRETLVATTCKALQ